MCDLLSVGLRKRKQTEVSGIFAFLRKLLVGLCVPNMFFMKANAKEDLGNMICLSIAQRESERKSPEFTCVIISVRMVLESVPFIVLVHLCLGKECV